MPPDSTAARGLPVADFSLRVSLNVTQVLRELLLMMNWRIVGASGVTPLSTHVMAGTLRLRRLAPLTLLVLAAASVALACVAYARLFKRKRE